MVIILVAYLINQPFPFIYLFVIESLLFVALIFIGTIFNKKIKLFCNEYKNVIVKNFLNTFLNDLTFNPDEGITLDAIKNTKMITINNLTSKNLVKATYNDISFSCSDAQIRSDNSDGNSRTSGYHEAIWITFDIKTNLSTDVIVQSKEFKLSKGPELFNKWHRIKYDYDPFNDKFKVYSYDNDYSLSTEIINVAMELPFDNFAILFHDMSIHIIICNTTLNFEPKLTHSIQTQMNKVDVQLLYFKSVIITCCNFVHIIRRKISN